jgi:acyl carrier protein
MEYKRELKGFIAANFLYGDTSALHDDTSFLQGGVIDSTGILELVFFLETTFNIKVHADEIVPQNLDSITKCAEFVARKLPKESSVRV